MASPGRRTPRPAPPRDRAAGVQRATRPARDRVLERRRLVVVWLVAAAPLVVLPGGLSRFVLAKLLVVAIACALGATLPRQGRLPRPVVLSLLAGAAVLTLAALAGDTPVASLVGRWPRYEGLPVLGLYAAAGWLGARVVGRGASRTLHLVHAVAAMSLVLAASSLLDAVGASPLGRSDLERSGSLLGNATDQGLVAMVAAVLVAGALAERRTPYLLLALGGSLLTVALSGSRLALLLTAVGLLALALRRRRDLLGPAVAAVAAMLAAALLTPVTRERLLSLETGRGRLVQWDLTLDLVRDHPWLGLGPSRYVDGFGAYEDDRWVEFAGATTTADSPHNLALQLLVAGGAPLLLAALALAWCLLRRVRTVLVEHPEAWPLAVATGLYVLALGANVTAAGPVCLVAFLGGALVAEAVPGADTGGEPRWRRTTTSAVLGATALVVLAACVAEVQLARGVGAAREGRVAEAAAHLDSARGWRPLDGDVAMLGAQALAGAANAGLPEAVGPTRSLAGQSLRRTPATYASLVALGVADIAAGDPAAALVPLDRAVAAYPSRFDARVQRGLARYGVGDVRGARQDLRHTRALAPGSPVPRRLLRLMAATPVV